MTERRIRGNDQVEVLDDRRGLQEIVQLTAEVGYGKSVGRRIELFGPGAFLQTEKLHPFDSGQGCEVYQRERAVPVVLVDGTSLPGDADLEGGEFAELGSPVLGALGIGIKVWHTGWDCGQGRSQDARYAQERRMDVKRGQRASSLNQPINPRTTSQESDERFRARHQNVATALFDQRREADELQRVAQSLFRMQQNRSSIQRRAVP